MIDLLKTKQTELEALLSKLQTRQDKYQEIGKHSEELDLTVAAVVGKLELIYEFQDEIQSKKAS